MRILLILIGAVVVVAALSTIAVYSYGRFAERSLGEPSYALPVGDDTPLDQAIAPMVSANGDRDGLVLLENGYDAFAARVLASRAAGRSLDLMYYIWEDDLTGGLLFDEVLRAADRGVRVRLILDDFTTHGSVVPYLALNSHENIEVRMFNPTRARENAFRRGLEMLLRLFSATRRMHNKAWIADARLAIVGGRNIGDDYFDATKASNFRDLDLMMLGPTVAESETIFDAFWNSTVVLPITALARGRQRPDLQGFLAAVEATSMSEPARPYLDRVRERVSMLQVLVDPGTVQWTDSAEVYSDPPEKALGEDQDNWLIGLVAV
jgi:putative cardiolipin synthase